MDDIFYLQGQVTTGQGLAIHYLRVAVVDKDLMFDDLLGIGITDEEGRFRISFTSAEFRQQALERERTPDIYLVFSAYDDGEFRSVARKEFFHLTFTDRAEDLGEIRIDEWNEEMPSLPDQKPTPGYRVVDRLNLTNKLVAHCLEEVAPLVESLTGWKGLLEDISVRVGKDVSVLMAEVTEQMGLGEADFVTRAIWRNMSFDFPALYEPFSKTIFINESAARKQNLDAFKVLLGHELVHVGQFQNFPDLIDEYVARFESLVDIIGSSSISDMTELLNDSGMQLHMSRIEGYACYIQEDFLQKYYNCATFFPSESFLSTIVSRVVKKIFPELESVAENKMKQYTEGKELFVDAGGEDGPAKFECSASKPSKSEDES